MRLFTLTLVALLTFAGPVSASCLTCSPQSECVSTENAAFCECKEKIRNLVQTCTIATPICLATTNTCGGGDGQKEIRPEIATPPVTLTLSGQALDRIFEDRPWLGHALDAMRTETSIEMSIGGPLVALTTGWRAGVIQGETAAAARVFEIALEGDEEGNGVFRVTFRHFDTDSMVEALKSGTLIEVVDGRIGDQGHLVEATVDGVAQRWNRSERVHGRR